MSFSFKNKIQTLLLLFIIFLTTFDLSCKRKQRCEDGPFYKGYIIGFDPCTAFSNTKKGYVIKFENTSDTIVAYFILPSNIVIPDSLFNDYRNNFLFPDSFRNSYLIRANYREANSSELVLPLCRPDILVADFLRSTKGKQYVIDCFQ